jgi:hypothetical protein
MAAISITAANVVSAGGTIETRTSGATITAGMVVYLDANGLAQIATNTASASALPRGIALDTASSGQPVTLQRDGDITIGGTAAVGKVYVIGTAGGIIPVDDIAGTEYIGLVGIGKTAAILTIVLGTAGVIAAGAVS